MLTKPLIGLVMFQTGVIIGSNPTYVVLLEFKKSKWAAALGISNLIPANRFTSLIRDPDAFKSSSMVETSETTPVVLIKQPMFRVGIEGILTETKVHETHRAYNLITRCRCSADIDADL